MSFDVNAVPGFGASVEHGFAGATIALAFGLFLPWHMAALIAVSAAVIKESAESLGIAFWEPKQPWAAGGHDVLQFLYGIGPATAILFVKHLV